MLSFCGEIHVYTLHFVREKRSREMCFASSQCKCASETNELANIRAIVRRFHSKMARLVLLRGRRSPRLAPVEVIASDEENVAFNIPGISSIRGCWASRRETHSSALSLHRMNYAFVAELRFPR